MSNVCQLCAVAIPLSLFLGAGAFVVGAGEAIHQGPVAPNPTPTTAPDLPVVSTSENEVLRSLEDELATRVEALEREALLVHRLQRREEQISKLRVFLPREIQVDAYLALVDEWLETLGLELYGHTSEATNRIYSRTHFRLQICGPEEKLGALVRDDGGFNIIGVGKQLMYGVSFRRTTKGAEIGVALFAVPEVPIPETVDPPICVSLRNDPRSIANEIDPALMSRAERLCQEIASHEDIAILLATIKARETEAANLNIAAANIEADGVEDLMTQTVADEVTKRPPSSP